MTVTPDAPTLPWISDTLLRLKECLCQSLTERGAGRPCWCGVWPGRQVPWEFCGECHNASCGMAFVQMTQAFPSSQFPAIDNSGTCKAPLAYGLIVGSLRCLPVAEEDGSLPGEGDILDSALAVQVDMAAMRYAIMCCFDNGNDAEYVLGTYEVLGPAGGCVGGQWSLTVTR